MSWIDQGRQQHGWFGSGTASGADPGELGARAFAIVQLAADDFPSRDNLPFPLEKTTEVLRTFASVMASRAGLAPSDFRSRFFRPSFDPVDAWAIQLVMRDIAAADTHDGLVRAGTDLAGTIRAHGPDGWNRLLSTAVAQVAPTRPATAKGDATVHEAQFAVPAGPSPLILPPQAVPGTPENRALTDATIEVVRKLGQTLGKAAEIIAGPLESRPRNVEEEDDEDGNGRRRPRPARPRTSEPPEAASEEGETRDKPPTGSKPINETPWSGNHTAIKDSIGARGPDSVRISPNEDVWLKNPNGTWTNRGEARDFIGSDNPSGRTGRERDRWPGS